MTDTRAQGLIDAHHIVAGIAAALPKVRWWQLGRTKYHQMAVLTEASQQIFDEVQKIYDARFNTGKQG